MTAPDTYACARWLQALGLYVFTVDHPGLPECAGAHAPGRPCDGTRGKHPCGKWGRDATRGPDIIRADLGHGPRNLGVACKPSHLLVIDEDRPGALAEYAAEHGEQLADTFTVATAKGHHRYYWQPNGEPLGNGKGTLAGRGIDVRGAQGLGGYVVAPGSVHESGVLYAPVDSSAPILPAPAWLIAALRTPRPTPAGPPTGPTVAGGRPHKVLTGLVRVVLDAKPGERNTRLYWAARRAYEHASWGTFDAAAARAALVDAAYHVGLGAGETDATLDSAARATTGGAA